MLKSYDAAFRGRAVAAYEAGEDGHHELAPRLRRGDIVLLDNLNARKSPTVPQFIEQRGATVRFLPPYSHDYNPLEPAWGLIRIRKQAPRTAGALRQVARAARHVVRLHHCRQWFRHAGHVNSSAHRD